MRLRTKISIALSFLLAFTGTALAAGAVTGDDGSLLDLAKPVLQAIVDHQWWMGGSLLLVLLCTAARKYAPGKLGEFFHTKHGGALLVLGGSFGGALASLLAGSAMSLGLMLTAGKVAFATAGSYSMVQALIVDPLMASDWYKSKAPTWLKALLSVVLWAFTKPDPVAKAEADGQAAVEAKPAEGTTPTTGDKPETF